MSSHCSIIILKSCFQALKGAYLTARYSQLNVCVPSKFIHEALTLSVAVFEDGASKEVSLNEVIRLGP